MQAGFLRAFRRGPGRGNMLHRAVTAGKTTPPALRVSGKGPSISRQSMSSTGTFVSRPLTASFRQLRFPRLSFGARFSRMPGRTFTSHFGRRVGNGKGTAKAARGPAVVEPLSLTARFKKLSREYGWVAFGVYIGLSILDFPFCFLLVRAVGTQKIGEIEHWVVSKAQSIIPDSVQEKFHDLCIAFRNVEQDKTGDDALSEGIEMAGWGVEEATERYNSDASLATQLALAYAIHKSFIFIRIPLTVGITPKVVKILRGWGWQIGKKKKTTRRRWWKR